MEITKVNEEETFVEKLTNLNLSNLFEENQQKNTLEKTNHVLDDNERGETDEFDMIINDRL
jgi:hypothetical protein